MHRIESILSAIDRAIGTKKRRHIVGGVLTSIAVLFSCLAVTVFSLNV